MDLLYTTTMKYTFDEYKKFSKTVMKKREKRMRISLLFLILVALLMWIVEPFSKISIFLIVFVIIYPIFLYFGINKEIRKAYDSNELLKDIELSIEFYKNYFLAKTEKSEAKIEYDKIYGILENDTNFYIMIGNNQGYLVLKENCTEELIKFIKETKIGRN